ncbi:MULTISPECIES: hypothetical protein [unclassified Microcoleus]
MTPILLVRAQYLARFGLKYIYLDRRHSSVGKENFVRELFPTGSSNFDCE